MKKIPLDKLYHFAAGFIIAVGVTFFYDPVYGLVAGVVAGVLKEAVDEYRYRGADFFDMFATVAGTFTGLVLYRVFELTAG